MEFIGLIRPNRSNDTKVLLKKYLFMLIVLLIVLVHAFHHGGRAKK